MDQIWKLFLQKSIYLFQKDQNKKITHVRAVFRLSIKPPEILGGRMGPEGWAPCMPMKRPNLMSGSFDAVRVEDLAFVGPHRGTAPTELESMYMSFDGGLVCHRWQFGTEWERQCYGYEEQDENVI
jgi:hypothetical protein